MDFRGGRRGQFIVVFMTLVLALLITSVPLGAQEVVELNQPATGTIPPGSSQTSFVFNASAGQTVHIQVTASAGLAVQFYIANSSGALVRAVPNTTQSATVEDTITFPDASQYTITIASVNGSSGDFVLTVSDQSSGGGAGVLPTLPPLGQATPVPPVQPTQPVAMTCSTLVNSVVSAVDTVCAGTGRNEACYGNVQVLAEPRAGVPAFTFQSQGDLVNVASVQRLTLSPMNASTGAWGVALLRIQANLPDTLPGQNVTMLIFGDVQIQNAGGESSGGPSYPVSIPTSSNVRSGPGTGYAVVTILAPGVTAQITGRVSDNSWLRVQTSDGTVGWIYGPIVASQIRSNLSSLPVVSATDTAPSYGPMQAFYFTTGIGQSECNEAPESGILIQTPQGVGHVDLTVNEVNINLGSTVFLQSVAGGNMTVSTLQGDAEVTAMGVTRSAIEGTSVSLPLTQDLHPAGPPEPPQPVDLNLLRPLPVQDLPDIVALPQPVEGVVLPDLPTSGPCKIATGSEIAVNIRQAPGTDFDVIGSMDPSQLYDVIGRNSDSSWYQLSNHGWAAASVTRHGGDCGGLPITYTPPTPTPSVPIAGNNEYPRVAVDFMGGPVTVSGAVSSPQGDSSDTIGYYWVNFPPRMPTSGSFNYTITCSGDTEYTYINFGDGEVVPCTTPYNFVQYFYKGVPMTGSFVVYIDSGNVPAYASWSVTFSFHP